MIKIENKNFCLTVDDNSVAKSLIFKNNGEECLDTNNLITLFSITQERIFNNELKLMYPNKKSTFYSNRIRKEDNKLFVGFELVEFEAVIEITTKDDYIVFELIDFVIPENTYGLGSQFINPAPISEFRFMQLPIKKRQRYGDWLNVMWDDEIAVNLLSASQYTIVDSDNKAESCVMYAKAQKDVKMKNCSAALVVSETREFLDCIDRLERDYCLPLGVESRRRDDMNLSIYWTGDINPQNVDEHIKYIKQVGFKKMLIYYDTIFKSEGYNYIGDYDLNEYYPNGIEDLKALLDKIKDAGISPGFHFLHPHIGIKSRYVTPVADHRLNLTRYFTLAKVVQVEDDVIYVEQNPEGAPLNPKFQVLKFDGEIIFYDSYTTEYPYCFKGCKRGYFNTNVISHSLGTIGGILDVSEFETQSVYIDQRTSLQDEVASKIAKYYNTGFEFIYFDGSEGTNPPFEFNIPYAQYKVYQKLDRKPDFCEGAAKSHFGWHMLSGGNAFDPFQPNEFKEKIAEFQMTCAKFMENNFTRVNFGWWELNDAIQPDIYEYGISKGTSFNCPVTIQFSIDNILSCPRKNDVFEVLSRWEDIKEKKLLTDEQKELLKDPNKEFILLVNEDGEYELCEYQQIENVAQGDKNISAFYFERCGKNYVVCWHKTGCGKLCVPFFEEFLYEEQLGKTPLDIEINNDNIFLPVSSRRYFSTYASKEKIISAFENSKIIEE